jgi:hypothetical protein
VFNVETAYQELLTWCRDRDYAGHDPFDALNSKLFQSSPLSSSRNARFIWTQLVKRSPVDLRSLSRVPPERNPKGVALFALALLAEYRRTKNPDTANSARQLLDDLITLQVKGFSGAAWGYNFDWQSRHFFAPRGTPTIVPTAFAARAFIEAARDLKDENYLNVARSVCDFILNDLPRSVESDSEVCFSYSPQDRTQIFNASLLAAEVLAEVGARRDEPELLRVAEKTANFVVKHQNPDGSWRYGTAANQGWIDNFHTAYVLYSLHRIIKAGSLDSFFSDSLRRGYNYWKAGFFLADGWPKYYHDDPYPADAHAGASGIITFHELREIDEGAVRLAERVASWTIENLRSREGFFYYQKRKFYTVKKPYMRWSQAWMLYALARLLEN